MSVNHDQFSQFSRLCYGSSALILQMVVILAQNAAFKHNIDPGLRSQCVHTVCVVEFWC